MTTAMTTAGIKRPSVIEYPTMKTALTRSNKGQGRWFVYDVRARSLPTFLRTGLWLAFSKNWLWLPLNPPKACSAGSSRHRTSLDLKVECAGRQP